MILAMLLLVVYYAKLSRLKKKTACEPKIQNMRGVIKKSEGIW